MYKRVLLLIMSIMVSLLLTNCQSTPKTPETIAEKIIDDMIETLQEQKYRKFLLTYYPPEKLERIIKAKKFNQAVSMFAGRTSNQLKLALKMAKERDPVINLNETRIVYNIPGFTITLVKIKEKWYLYL